MARRLTEKFESSRVGDFPVNRLLWSISESNRHPAVRLLPRELFLCRRRYTRKLRQRLAIASTLCMTIYGRLPPQGDSAGVDGMDARIYPAC